MKSPTRSSATHLQSGKSQDKQCLGMSILEASLASINSHGMSDVPFTLDPLRNNDINKMEFIRQGLRKIIRRTIRESDRSREQVSECRLAQSLLDGAPMSILPGDADLWNRVLDDALDGTRLTR